MKGMEIEGTPVEILGATGGPLGAEEVMAQLRGFAARHGVVVQPFDPSLVFGREHVASAVGHAIRAWRQGRASSRSLGGEVLLYASGERQLSAALPKMGLKGRVSSIALAVIGTCPVEELLGVLGWARDDGILTPEGKDPVAYGLSPEEISTLPSDPVALILERVALVDLLK